MKINATTHPCVYRVFCLIEADGGAEPCSSYTVPKEHETNLAIAEATLAALTSEELETVAAGDGEESKAILKRHGEYGEITNGLLEAFFVDWLSDDELKTAIKKSIVENSIIIEGPDENFDRFKQAYDVQNACNPAGVARLLVQVITDVQNGKDFKGTDDLCTDDAIVAIVEKLHSMMDTDSFALLRCGKRARGE